MSRKSIIIIILILFTSIVNLVPIFNAEILLKTGKSFWIDLAQHFIYYFVLSLLLLYFFHPKKELLIVLAIIGGATVLEIAQALTPGVKFSYHDIMSNVAGIVAAYCIWFALKPRIGINKKSD